MGSHPLTTSSELLLGCSGGHSCVLSWSQLWVVPDRFLAGGSPSAGTVGGLCTPREGREALGHSCTPKGSIPAGNTGLEPVWRFRLVLQAPEGIGENIPTPSWHAVGIQGTFFCQMGSSHLQHVPGRRADPLMTSPILLDVHPCP